MGAGFMRCPECKHEFMWSTWNGFQVQGEHLKGCSKPKTVPFDPTQVTKGGL